MTEFTPVVVAEQHPSRIRQSSIHHGQGEQTGAVGRFQEIECGIGHHSVLENHVGAVAAQISRELVGAAGTVILKRQEHDFAFTAVEHAVRVAVEGVEPVHSHGLHLGGCGLGGPVACPDRSSVRDAQTEIEGRAVGDGRIKVDKEGARRLSLAAGRYHRQRGGSGDDGHTEVRVGKGNGRGTGAGAAVVGEGRSQGDGFSRFHDAVAVSARSQSAVVGDRHLGQGQVGRTKDDRNRFARPFDVKTIGGHDQGG